MSAGGYLLLGYGTLAYLVFVGLHGGFDGTRPHAEALSSSLAGVEGMWHLLNSIIVAPLIEELLYRGFLYAGLVPLLGIRPSIVLTAVVFALAHPYWFNWPAIFLLGIGLGHARSKTGSIWSGFFAHSIYNVAMISIPISIG